MVVAIAAVLVVVEQKTSFGPEMIAVIAVEILVVEEIGAVVVAVVVMVAVEGEGEGVVVDVVVVGVIPFLTVAVVEIVVVEVAAVVAVFLPDSVALVFDLVVDTFVAFSLHQVCFSRIAQLPHIIPAILNTTHSIQACREAHSTPMGM